MSAEPELAHFIVDNSGSDAKVLHHISAWCDSATGLDIASGHFEIGALLALREQWPKVGQIRLLMGDEVSLRTKREFDRALEEIVGQLNDSLEDEKNRNDFLDGVDRIVEALRSEQIRCRVYRKEKFHAKTYIARAEGGDAHALVGSSNFTVPGLTENVELNVQHSGKEAEALAAWFERHWAEAEDVTPEVLRVIERHVREYSPYEVYAKALEQLFAGYQQTVTDWESGKGDRKSVMFPRLDGYQQIGYKQLQKIAARYRGAFLCDGVGLGKTYVGLMLIEWLVRWEGKRVALFVPKAARAAVWEAALERELPDLGDAYGPGVLIFNHTDLTRDNAKIQKQLDDVARRHDVVVIIDEAHHFRNPGTRGAVPVDVLDPLKPGPGYIPGAGIVRPSRYRRLYDIVEGKTLFLLTATPVNNRLIDLQHMIELFSARKEDGKPDPACFSAAPLGIHSLPGYFRRIEAALQKKLGLKSPTGEGSAENLPTGRPARGPWRVASCTRCAELRGEFRGPRMPH